MKRINRARARWRRGVVGIASILTVLLGSASVAQDRADDRALRLGFTRGVFQGANESDLLAAMKVWAQTLSEERRVEVDSDMRLFDSIEQAAEEVRTGQVDAVSLLLSEYLAFPSDLLGGPFLVDELAGRREREFVILVRRDADVQRVEDLSGTRLAIHEDRNSSLARRWLDARLAESELGATAQIVAAVEADSRLSKVILSVFFGTNDACLVTRAGFRAMAELNPQVSARLSVLESSPSIVPSLFCFRDSLAPEARHRLTTEILNLHRSPRGEQVLRVFKSDRMAELTGPEVDRSIELLRSWRELALRGPREIGSRSR